MTDKKLVTERFSKNFKTYDDNAFVQNIMAFNLIKVVPYNKFGSIFEVGCGTGTLTKYIDRFFLYDSYTANDIVKESEFYIKNIIKNGSFVCGDIEEIKINEKFDLIISNACLQWCNDIDKTVTKLAGLLNKNGILAFSVFGNKNLCEIKKIFNVSLQYFDIKKLKISDDLKTIYAGEEIKKIYFDSPIEILKHFKLTGVNAVSKTNFTKTKLKEFETGYKKLFCRNGKCYITYNPSYVVLQKII